MVRIALTALTANFVALACAVAAPAEEAAAERQAEPPQAEAPQSSAPAEDAAATAEQQSEPPQSPAPAEEAAETAEQQPQAAAPQASGPSGDAAQTAGQQSEPQQSQSSQAPQAAAETVAQPSADALQQLAAAARFKVEAMGFRAVDESGPNHPDSDAVFAVFESQRQSMVTHVFDSVDTGDAKDFAAGENCIFPVHDADEPRNGAWQCSPEGGGGPVRFAIAFYELDPDYVGSFTASFCTPEGAADVEVRHRNCDTEHSDLLFRSELSYQAADILKRIDGACRCFSETVRYRESNGQGAVEYHVTFRITRTDEGAAAAIPASDANSARAVFRHGARSAALGQGFELDGGVTAALGPDLAFSGAAPSEFVLAPAGGAKIWPGDHTSRGYAACRAERRSANYVTTAVAPSVGQYACYVTNNGRVGELRVDNVIASFSTAVLSVTFTTWR